MTKYLAIFVLVVGIAGWGQTTTYNLNNDTSAHGFSLPIPCPSTTGGNCTNSQAKVGVNSIWAECALSGASAFNNPECSGGQLAASSSSAASTNSQYVHITRVTDSATLGSPAITFAGTVGGAGDVTWSADATRLMVVNSFGGVIVPFTFDPNPASPTYMQVTKPYGSNTINSETAACSKLVGSAKHCYMLQSGSNVTGLAGHANHYVIVDYDFTSTSSIPTITNSAAVLLVDLNTTCSASLPNWFGTGVLSVSDDDNTFFWLTNQAGGQDTANFVGIWHRNTGTTGCTTWQTDTGTITFPSGSTGTIVNGNSLTGTWPPHFVVHEVQGFHDGGKLFLQEADGGCVGGNNCDGNNNTTGGTNFIWETGIPYAGHASPTGLNVYPMLYPPNSQGSGTFYGHSMQGYTLWDSEVGINSANTAPYFMHTATGFPSTNFTQITPSRNPGGSNCYQIILGGTPGAFYCPFFDQHTSWANNTNSADTAPFFSITYEQQATNSSTNLVPDTPQFAWGDEILIQPTSCYPACVGNNPWRLTHTYTTPEITHAATFTDYIGIGTVSPVAVNNQYFVSFTSNWEGQLGCTDGTFGSSSAPAWNQCTGGMASLTFYSCTGCVATGAIGTTCTLDTFSGSSGSNGSGSVVRVTLGTLNLIDGNATFAVTTAGTGVSWSGPTTALIHSGTATCTDSGHTIQFATQGTVGPRADVFVASVPIAAMNAPGSQISPGTKNGTGTLMH